MASKKKPNVFKSKLTSLTSKSRNEFIQEYNKYYDEPKKRDLYCKISREIEIFISQGNLDLCKKLNKLLQHIGEIEDTTILEKFEKDENNPLRKTNLVILACKHNKVDILNHILDVEKKNANITPNATDDANHNGFYYAIRSNNTNLLDMLVNRWPGNYFVDDPQALDDILSQAYEELKLKNVPLSEEMEFFVESKLINLRFFSESHKTQKAVPVDLKTIKERIELVIENIHLLREEYLNIESIDQKFLFIATFIAQNIHILKRQLKSTYDRLPWEEIEFCLVSFISSYETQNEINLFYRTTLNKVKIINVLDQFAKKLDHEKDVIQKSRNKETLAELPSSKRESVVANIMKNNPQFIELYNDYHSLRDIHSLQKINDCINLALSANPKEKEGQLIITRVLQVIGEYFKNTLESPKLSATTSQMLLLLLPKNTREIVMRLRNSLSHSFSISKRIELQENTNAKFYRDIQNDTKKISDGISSVLYDKKLNTVRTLLKKVIDSESLDDSVKEVGAILGKAKLEFEFPVNYVSSEHEKIKKLLIDLKNCLDEETRCEFQTTFKEIDVLMKNCTEVLSEIHTRENFMKGFLELKKIQTNLWFVDLKNKNFKHNFRTLKKSAQKILNDISPKVETCNLKTVAEQTQKIFHYLWSKGDSHLTDEVTKILFDICYLAERSTGNTIKMIHELGDLLGKKCSTGTVGTRNVSNTNRIDRSKQVGLKISQLNDIMKGHGLNEDILEKVSIYKNNKKVQAAVEMLVLDIMSILGSSKSTLENDLFFLDNSTPLLIGKSLRNHLAHDNNLFDILLPDPTLAILLNAKKITSEDILNKRMGRLVKDDPTKLKEMYNTKKATIENQEELYVALQEGRCADAKSSVIAGADMNARNIILGWTTLHFACKGPSVECVKLVLQNNSDLHIKDAKGQTPLHIAAANGRTHTLKLILERVNGCIDDQDNYGQSALHLAASNGYIDAVRALLENGANTRIQTIGGNCILSYAAYTKHTDVAMLLWEKDPGVESMGGFVALHYAAEVGLTDFVKFLLENGEDVNCVTDRNYTPLHGAAFYGHTEVVQVLLSKGANVNVRTVNGCSSLHNAVENGFEDIANILIAYGANVDFVEKTYNNTPLHYAAMDGLISIVKILIQKKANVNALTSSGSTPLHEAAAAGHLFVVRYLLENGSDINAKDLGNCTPLLSAVYCGQVNVVDELLCHKALRKSKFMLSELLQIAIKNKHKNLVNLLIEKGADVNHRFSHQRTPLHEAASNGNKIIIDLLLKNNANIEAKDHDSCTPLHLVCFKGQADAVEILLKNNAQVNAKAILGTPLHIAVLAGNKEAVHLLLKYNADVNNIAIECTPLFLAIEAGHKEIAKILMTNRAKVKVKKIKQSPLLSAVHNNDEEMVKIILEHDTTLMEQNSYLAEACLMSAVYKGNADIFNTLLKYDCKSTHKKKIGINCSLLHIASKVGVKDIVNSLISKGSDINAKTSSGITPLGWAALEGNTEIVELLIANGAHVNSLGTPLHYAASGGFEDIVEILLENKASVNVKDDKKRTSLELAVANGYLNISKLLLKNKDIDVNTKGNDDWTLLHIATDKGKLEMIKFLVDRGSNLHAKNTSGSKPLHLAAREGFKSIVEFFISRGMDINDPGMLNQTAVHYASMKGQSIMLKYLITQGANIHIKDLTGITPLHMAAKYGHPECVQILLQHGADYTAVENRFQLTPLELVALGSQNEKVYNLLATTENLFQAVKHNNQSDVKKFIKAGAFVDAKRGDSGTALHFAAWKGYDDIVRILLEKNADPNATCKNKMTPLHYAAKFCHEKVVKILLANGAIFEALTDKEGQSPFEITKDVRISKLFDLIVNSFKQVKNGKDSVIRSLNEINDALTVRAVLCARNKENETLIVTAMHTKFLKVEELKTIHQGDIVLQLSIAELCFNQGDYQKALKIFRNMHERRKDVMGPNNPATLEIGKRIGSTLYVMGSVQEALSIVEDVFEKQRDALGEFNKDALDTRGLMGLLLHRLGRCDEALPILRDVYQKQSEILGSTHSETLNTYFHMALVLNVLGEYDEALNINKTVFEQRKRKSGENSREAITALNNIGLVLSNQGKFEDALAIYTDVLEKKKIVFGDKHVSTLKTYSLLIDVILQQKNLKEALCRYQDLLKTMKDILGIHHPDTLKVQCKIGEIYFNQGKWINALKSYKEILDRSNALFGTDLITEVSRKLEALNQVFKIQGSNTSEVIQHLQNEINLAAQDGDIGTIQNLLKSGADINNRDVDGRTPLHFAVNSEKIAVVKFLLKNGADVTQCTNKGNTPLHTATSKVNGKIVDILLDHVGQDQLTMFINAKTTGSGTTALHIAAKNNAIDSVRSLLKRGAVYNIKNRQGKMPVDVATEPKVVNIFELIEDVFNQAKNGNFEFVNKLKNVECETSLVVTNARNDLHKTILQVAISAGHKKLVKALLEMLKKQS